MDIKGILDFSGKKVLITGVASGMGKATALLLSSLGATIIGVDYNEKGLAEVMASLGNPCSIGIRANLIEQSDLEFIFEKAVYDGVKLTGMVHCAGMAQVLPLNMLSRDKAEREMAVNYFSFIELVRQYAKRKYSVGGSIVGISSIAAAQPEQCQTNYAASKSAMNTAVRALAPELSQKRIRINSILPGATNTPMAAQNNGRDIEAILSKQVLGMVQPSDVANACLFLLSDMARMITGRQLFIDGGRLE